MWNGENAGLDHIGMENVQMFSGDMEGGEMKPFYEELKRGDTIGVILLQNPTRDEKKVTGVGTDKVVWTESGHYVFVAGFKKVGSKFYMYIKNSGSTPKSGWYNYTKHMKGGIRRLWTARVPKELIDLPSKGYFELGDSSPEIIKIQKFLKKRGFYNGACRGNMKVLTYKATMKYQERYKMTVDGKFGAQCLRQYYKLEVKK
jgi:hypothetical protein